MGETTTAPAALPSGAAPPRRRMDWWKLISGVLVIGALAGIVTVFAGYKGDEESLLPKTIEVLSPTPGSPVVPSQTTVTADLLFGYDGALKVDGTEIPRDQYDSQTSILSQGLFSFTPGPDKEFRRFRGGSHIATIVFWPVNGTRERDANEFSWRFTVN